METITSAPHRAPLRLVSTKEMSRDEWLEARKQGIGASEAAAAIGISPYQSQLELWSIPPQSALPRSLIGCNAQRQVAGDEVFHRGYAALPDVGDSEEGHEIRTVPDHDPE